MAQVVIENPVINSPFEEPKRHFIFDDDGITDQIAEERRRSFLGHPPPNDQPAFPQAVDGQDRHQGHQSLLE